MQSISFLMRYRDQIKIVREHGSGPSVVLPSDDNNGSSSNRKNSDDDSDDISDDGSDNNYIKSCRSYELVRTTS